LKNRLAKKWIGPNKSSCPRVRRVVSAGLVRGRPTIPGGGITDNLPRVLPGGTAAVVELGTWTVPPVFTHMQKIGNVPPDEMLRTFNMGVGMILVVPAKKYKKVETLIEKCGEKSFLIGRIVKGDRQVTYV